MISLEKVKKSKNLTLLDSNSTFGPIRTVPIGNNEFLFHAKDCAVILEYKNTNHAILTHVPKNQKVKLKNKNFKDSDLTENRANSKHRDSRCFGLLSKPGDYFITEEGLYRLISGSKMPKAEEFKSWVFGELIPTFRKTGKYDKNDFEKSQYYSTIKDLPGFCESAIFKEDSKRSVLDAAHINRTLTSCVWRDFVNLFNDVYHVNLNLKVTNLMRKYDIKKRPTMREYLDYAKLHKKAYIIFEMLKHDKSVKINPEKLSITKAMCDVYYAHLNKSEREQVDHLMEIMLKENAITPMADDRVVKDYKEVGDLIYAAFA